ncbi:MAG TPA: TrmH family RNA methyltransferase [Micromonosporaceae bacterium]|nr:TrmH family RNA methyltransferase [Micromonosporaceae bacterium]
MQLQQIGLSHPRVKQVLQIQHNTAPNRLRFFVAEGLWAHNAILHAGAPIETFLWCPEAAYSDEARVRAVEIAGSARHAYQISERTLERLSEGGRPDGLLSVAGLPWWEPDDLPLGETALVLVADAVEIPGNLGTLIRTLDGCRADCLILTNRRTRLTHPKVVRASQGTVLTVPTVEFAEADDAARWLVERGFTVYLADTDDARSYRSVEYAGRVALVVGSERYGISKSWYSSGFDRVAVPMLGSADSLNVSVSASILLYEARAQQHGW